MKQSYQHELESTEKSVQQNSLNFEQLQKYYQEQNTKLYSIIMELEKDKQALVEQGIRRPQRMKLDDL